MPRLAFEGFSIDLPNGWSEALDEATYSDTNELPPHAFCTERGPGTFYVALPALEPEEVPAADPAELAALARDWGARRGVDAPLRVAGAAHPAGAVGSADFRVGDDFVAVWFLSDGEGVLCASYVCPWPERDAERDAREHIAASLLFD